MDIPEAFSLAAPSALITTTIAIGDNKPPRFGKKAARPASNGFFPSLLGRCTEMTERPNCTTSGNNNANNGITASLRVSSVSNVDLPRARRWGPSLPASPLNVPWTPQISVLETAVPQLFHYRQ